MSKQPIIYLDGQYLKTDAKTLEFFTPGAFKAQGVFETMLAYGSQVFDVKDHLKRFQKGFPNSKVSSEVIQKVVELNGFDMSRVRLIGHRKYNQKHVAVMVLKYRLPAPRAYRVCLIKTNRQADESWANVKSLDYKMFAEAYQKARAWGFDEALLINNRGHVFEASRSNVFWFKANKLYTPPLSCGCLNGITRAKVIALARKLKIPFSQEELTIQELNSADQVFLTNSLIGIKEVKNFFPLLPR